MEAAKASEFPFLMEKKKGRKRGKEKTIFSSSFQTKMLSRR